MQLLKIKNIPIEYKIRIESPRLVYKQAQPRAARINRTPSDLKMKSENIKVRMDTSDMRSSLGLKDAATLISEAARNGLEAAKNASAQYAQMGNQLSQIQQGVTVSQIVSQRMLEQPISQTVFLPTVGPEITWQANSLDIKYYAGNLDFDWQIEKNVMDYVPGKFEMSIMQYPKVEIEYMGEPSYVPPSANPNYEEKND